MQNIHFVDNTNLDLSDKYPKLRPLLRLFGDQFWKQFQPKKLLSHNEAMIKYFGRHGCKQWIPGKPTSSLTKYGALTQLMAICVLSMCTKAELMKKTRRLKKYGKIRGYRDKKH